MVSTEQRTAAVILAAGKATRMGVPKVLLRDDADEYLFSYAFHAAWQGGCRPVIAVISEHSAPLADDPAFSRARFVRNQCAIDGMATSLRAGVDAVPSDVSSVMILLADQPFVTSELIARLRAAHVQHPGCAVIRPVFVDVPGHPILFSSRLMKELRACQGDVGARHLLRRYEKNTLTILAPKDTRALDIDTPEDFAQYKRIRASLYTDHPMD
ncbi:nucleotidyltransferase family protein [Ferroacidibacillus organovorans]|uniref:MobA-like NTP transferase domain-containing protein n=1 Tax=Ferroacidibacillus organovorans TaxID=1765683 RepID=A0A162T9G7_9BACL|nr:nucleotidyltransferase family protein [Ferroacidibacillus organovorans]KYP80589.1 hypothetical protein AYJ22_10750 [Ferroacidibacillus organovorans]OAG92902.1 hypothetical protein AYW79_12895 [Ferroacidibacillus organovorans]OPG15853.1 hypothetical protein B2M26_09600 [Ferroacidibacillus organovorans]